LQGCQEREEGLKGKKKGRITTQLRKSYQRGGEGYRSTIEENGTGAFGKKHTNKRPTSYPEKGHRKTPRLRPIIKARRGKREKE